MNDAQKQAIIDEVIAFSSRPKPPADSFSLNDFCRRFREVQGRPISGTAARRLLVAQVEAGLLETGLFQGVKCQRYWWKKSGTETALDDEHDAEPDRV